MTLFKEAVEDAIANGETVPVTELQGFYYQVDDKDPLSELPEGAVEKRRVWLATEVNELLPDYATWTYSLSSITLPIDKLEDFIKDVDWDDIKGKTHKAYLDAEKSGLFDYSIRKKWCISEQCREDNSEDDDYSVVSWFDSEKEAKKAFSSMNSRSDVKDGKRYIVEYFLEERSSYKTDEYAPEDRPDLIYQFVENHTGPAPFEKASA